MASIWAVHPGEGHVQSPVGYSEPQWYAAYTWANHEKRVADQFAERKVERDAIEGTLAQQLAGFGDRVGSGGPEAYLLRYLAKDREMEFGVLDDQ